MQSKKKIIIKIAAVTFWVAVWFILAFVKNNRLLIPSPVDTIEALVSMMRKGPFYISVAGSLTRIMGGFLIGSVMGAALAFAGYKSGFIRELSATLAGLCKSVPVAVFAVILLILFGHEQIGFLISWIVVFPIVFINISEGLTGIDDRLLQMAEVFNMPSKNRAIYIVRPALKPYIISCVKTGIGMAWKAGVAAEVIGLSNASIGGELYASKVYFETAQVFAWAIIIVTLSVVMEKLMLCLVKGLLELKPPCKEAADYTPQPVDVEISHLYKNYGDKVVYEDYSCHFTKGGENTISTASGSGKTTLLHMIAGILKPDKGDITAGRISMIFQEDRLSEEYSAVINVCMTGVKESIARAALAQVLDSDCLGKPCKELSGGMKRRVAVVRAMTYSSDIVLMDEPYTGMDEDTIGRVKKYIDEAADGRTLIVASHIL